MTREIRLLCETIHAVTQISILELDEEWKLIASFSQWENQMRNFFLLNFPHSLEEVTPKGSTAPLYYSDSFAFKLVSAPLQDTLCKFRFCWFKKLFCFHRSFQSFGRKRRMCIFHWRYRKCQRSFSAPWPGIWDGIYDCLLSAENGISEYAGFLPAAFSENAKGYSGAFHHSFPVLCQYAPLWAVSYAAKGSSVLFDPPDHRKGRGFPILCILLRCTVFPDREHWCKERP